MAPHLRLDLAQLLRDDLQASCISPILVLDPESFLVDALAPLLQRLEDLELVLRGRPQLLAKRLVPRY